MALCPGLPGSAGTRKIKLIWILLKQKTVSGSGISWSICKSAPCSRQITMPAPHHSVFYRLDALPVAQRTASKHWRHSLSYCQNILCHLNKRVFSFTRQLTMWHCLRVLLSAGHEAFKWYLLATKPTAANPPQRHATTKWWDDEDRRVDRQTDRQTDARQFPCSAYYVSRVKTKTIPVVRHQHEG